MSDMLRERLHEEFANRLSNRKSDSSNSDESVSSAFSEVNFEELDIRNLDLESLSLEDSGNPKNRIGIKCLTRSHRKLCRTKAIHSRPGLHLSNSAEMIKRPKSGRSKSDFMARRNLEDLELLDKMSTVMSRHCSTRSSTIEPVLESCLE